jgi:hypothetical protein
LIFEAPTNLAPAQRGCLLKLKGRGYPQIVSVFSPAQPQAEDEPAPSTHQQRRGSIRKCKDAHGGLAWMLVVRIYRQHGDNSA